MSFSNPATMDISEIAARIIENPLDKDWPDPKTITYFLHGMKNALAGVPNLARFSGDTLFVGDIHGDFDSIQAALRLADEHESKACFLGDLIDRGSHNVECLNLLLARMQLEPDRIFYTRGNHEFQGINSKWGFMDSVLDRYPETVYLLYNSVFTQLPIAALQNHAVYGIHGGISRHSQTLLDIEALEHQGRGFRDEYIDLLWNDPATEPQKGFEMNNKRGIFYTFGQDVFDEFMDKNGLCLFIRGHNVQKQGYRYFFNDRLISIFSSGDHYKDTVPSAVLVRDNGQHEILRLHQ